MRLLFILGLLLLPSGALADAAYPSGSRLCATVQELKAPPAPGPACANFRLSHAAVIAYARDAIASCMQADHRFSALKESIARGCTAAPGSPGCGQAMVAAENDYAEMERGFASVRARNEKPVTSSFPVAGERIASGCLPLLDGYQEFAAQVSGAVNDSVRAVNAERAGLRQKVAALLKARGPAAP